MTRRTTYKIVEGTKEQPTKLLVKVSSHNYKYGRASLPPCLIGKVVEVIIPADAAAAELQFGNGESPGPIKSRKSDGESKCDAAISAALATTHEADKEAEQKEESEVPTDSERTG